LVWLLRRSDGDGGGDNSTDERSRYMTLGRWAGDRLVLIGDYDSSKLYQEASNHDDNGEPIEYGEYADISAVLRQEFNAAVARDGGGSDYQL
jgi:hypothetical protein